MSHYPGAIYPVPSFGTNMSDVETHTTWRDNMVAEVRAIELELGTTPSGTFSTVASRLDAERESFVHVAFTPAGATDASVVGGGNIWVTLTSSLNVPLWCTKVDVVMTAAAIHSITAASTYLFRVGMTGANATARTMHQWTAISDRRNAVWTSEVLNPITGAGRSLFVHAERNAGTGQGRADASSRFDALVIFRAA